MEKGQASTGSRQNELPSHVEAMLSYSAAAVQRGELDLAELLLDQLLAGRQLREWLSTEDEYSNVLVRCVAIRKDGAHDPEFALAKWALATIGAIYGLKWARSKVVVG